MADIQARRVAFALDQADMDFLDELKRTKFYNASYSDMYRYLMHKGIVVERSKSDKCMSTST